MLHPYHSPQEKAISNINLLLNNQYKAYVVAPNIHASKVNFSIHSKQKQQPALCSTVMTKSQSNYDIVIPIINKLSRKSKQHYTPLQQYKRLHYSPSSRQAIRSSSSQNEREIFPSTGDGQDLATMANK